MEALQFLVFTVSVWLTRRQQKAIEYLREENRVLRENVGRKRLRFTDKERRRLAIRAKKLERKAIGDSNCIVTPDTLLRWYRELVASKYDGSKKRGPGKAQVSETIRKLAVRMAKENPGGGYTRIGGAEVGRSTIRRILS